VIRILETKQVGRLLARKAARLVSPRSLHLVDGAPVSAPQLRPTARYPTCRAPTQRNGASQGTSDTAPYVRRIAMRFPIALILMILSLFTETARGTPEQDFWNWFEKNEAALFDFEKDEEAVFDRLTTAMHRVHPNITFEFGPKHGDQREFVISADGIKEAFPKVISLHAAAPKLPRWTFIRFRPRREPMDITYNGVSARAREIQFSLEADGEKAGITLFIPGHSAENHKTMTGIAFLMLDQALGEFDVETKVGLIEVASPDTSRSTKKPLKELPKAFDDFTFNAKP